MRPFLALLATASLSLLGGCLPKSTACYGISDAEAIDIAVTNLRHTRMKDNLMFGLPVGQLRPTAIVKNTYNRGDDGAVYILFQVPGTSARGGPYQAIFEDCDTEWWFDETGSGANGFPWTPLPSSRGS